MTSGSSITLRPNGWSPISSRSEEHTSELQSLMRISYAVFCLKKKKKKKINRIIIKYLALSKMKSRLEMKDKKARHNTYVTTRRIIHNNAEMRVRQLLPTRQSLVVTQDSYKQHQSKHIS